LGRPSYSGGGGAPSGDRRPRRDFRQSYNRRKVCQFCVDKISYIDYKDVNRLRRFINERARIEPRRSTGTCARHQRRLSVAIKRARTLALLPFTPEQLKTLGFTRPEGFRGRSDSGGGFRGRPRPEGGYGGERRPYAGNRDASPAAPTSAPPSVASAPATASEATPAAVPDSAPARSTTPEKPGETGE
jgi:small subunit ribosomal protein S18